MKSKDRDFFGNRMVNRRKRNSFEMLLTSTFVQVSLDQTSQLEGSQPRKKNNFYIDKKDFEINESDEDMYSDSYYDGSKPHINKTKDMMGKMIMQKNKNNAHPDQKIEELIKIAYQDKFIIPIKPIKYKQKSINEIPNFQTNLKYHMNRKKYVPPKQTSSKDLSMSNYDDKISLLSNLNSFYQKNGKSATGNYDQPDLIQNHIAFKNSFYRNNKNLDSVVNITKERSTIRRIQTPIPNIRR